MCPRKQMGNSKLILLCTSRKRKKCNVPFPQISHGILSFVVIPRKANFPDGFMPPQLCVSANLRSHSPLHWVMLLVMKIMIMNLQWSSALHKATSQQPLDFYFHDLVKSPGQHFETDTVTRPFYRCRYWGSERWSNLCEVTQQVRRGVRLPTQPHVSAKPVVAHYVLNHPLLDGHLLAIHFTLCFPSWPVRLSTFSLLQSSR